MGKEFEDYSPDHQDAILTAARYEQLRFKDQNPFQGSTSLFALEKTKMTIARTCTIEMLLVSRPYYKKQIALLEKKLGLPSSRQQLNAEGGVQQDNTASSEQRTKLA